MSAAITSGIKTAEVRQDPATMTDLWRHVCVILWILLPFAAITCFLVLGHRHGTAPDPAKLFQRQYVTGGHYWVADFPDDKLTLVELQILDYPQYLLRTYRDLESHSNKPVYLCVVSSEDNRKGTHPPDVCLEGAGSHIQQWRRRDVAVNAGQVISMTELVTEDRQANGQDGNFYYCYVYKCGQRFTPSYYWQQYWIIWNGLAHRDADGALIRLSTPMPDMTEYSVEQARERTDSLLQAAYGDITRLGIK